MVAQINRPHLTLSSHFSDKLPPSNIEAEEAILGGILLDSEAISRVADLLTPDHFYIYAHGLIYDACLCLYRQGYLVDLMSVTTFLGNNERLEKVGGQLKLAQLVDRTVSAVNIDQYAELVADKAARRRLIENAYKQIGLAHELHTPLGTVLSEVENTVSTLNRSFSRNKFVRESTLRFREICQELENIEDELDNNEALKQWELRELAKKYGFGSGASGVRDLLNFHTIWLNSQNKTRSMSLDEYVQKFGLSPDKWLLTGWLPAESITLLHAKGGEGKTRLTGSICKSLIEGKPWGDYLVSKPCQILFIESDQSERVTANQLLEQGFIDIEDPEIRSRFRPRSNWGIEQYGSLRAEIKDMQEKHPEIPILIVIDSLSAVSTSSRYSENDQEYARPLMRLREIASKFGVTFLILHHSNAEGKSRGTTAIHNSVDQVWRLERTASSEKVEANLIIQKTRCREPGTYRLEYNPENWHWDVKGFVVEVDGDSQIQNYSAREKAIIQFFKENPNVPYEKQELAEILGISETTLGKDLGFLKRRGLISSVRRPGAKSYWYFLGELSADPADPKTKMSADPDNGNTSNPLPERGLTILKPADPADPQKNEQQQVATSEKKVDQLDQQKKQTENVDAKGDTPDPKKTDQLDQLDQEIQYWENWTPGETQLKVNKKGKLNGCKGTLESFDFREDGEIFVTVALKFPRVMKPQPHRFRLADVEEVRP